MTTRKWRRQSWVIAIVIAVSVLALSLQQVQNAQRADDLHQLRTDQSAAIDRLACSLQLYFGVVARVLQTRGYPGDDVIGLATTNVILAAHGVSGPCPTTKGTP